MGLDVKGVGQVPPSLEDVFLDLVERAGARMRKALAVGRKEFHQIARDRRTLMVLLFVPVFMLLLFGYALNFDIRHVRLAVEDNDRSTVSRDVISAFVNSGYFDLTATPANAAQFERLIDFGQVRAVLVIPEGLERRLLTGLRTPVQVVIDGDNANTATTVMGYALRILQTVSARYQRRAGGAAAAWPAPVGRAAHLVQPGAAERAVPGPGPHRVHRHAVGGHFHRTVRRGREGARHHGAGAHGAHRNGRVCPRKDGAVFRDLDAVGPVHLLHVDGPVRPADEWELGAPVAGHRAVRAGRPRVSAC